MIELTRSEVLSLPVYTYWAARVAARMLVADPVFRAWWTARGWMGEA